MRRVSVVGSSGSGKTTVGRVVAERLGLEFVELDAVHHLENWTPIDPTEFTACVGALTASEGWVVDGNYRAVVRDGPVWARADTIVWLDVSRRVAMWQVTRRTLGRAVRRTELWNGNRERWSNIFAWAPERNMMRWTWTRHHPTRERYRQLLDPPPAGVDVVRLTSRRQIAAWLATL